MTATVGENNGQASFQNSDSNASNIVEFDPSLEKKPPITAIIPGPEGELKLPSGRGTIRYIKEFLTHEESSDLLRTVQGSELFQRTIITSSTRNMTYYQPRDTLFYGNKLYSYGGEKRKPIDWNNDPPSSTLCRKISNKIEETLGLSPNYFNVVLVNKYNSGHDFMEWHADNEKNLGSEPIIASLSVGEERNFLFRPTVDSLQGRPVEIIDYSLANGSLVVMSGEMQKYYQHSVPVSKDSKMGVRLNFTFRKIIDENDFSLFPPQV